MLKKILLFSITLYQKTLSPDHGLMQVFYPAGYCRHQPSCSAYALLAVQKYGAGFGTIKTLARLLRCNPWSRGGYDPV